MPHTAEDAGDWLEEEIEKEERQMDPGFIEDERQERAQKEAGLDRFRPQGYIAKRLLRSAAMRRNRGRIGQ